MLSTTYDSFFSDGFTLSAEASIKYKLIITQFSNPLLCLIYTGINSDYIKFYWLKFCKHT